VQLTWRRRVIEGMLLERAPERQCDSVAVRPGSLVNEERGW